MDKRLLRLREEDGGFSSLGMLIALGLSLVLVFSGFRVYRVQTVSAGIQDVADVAVLAAENQVSTFVSVARICDAVVLSFSLTGIVCGLVGVAALVVPGTAEFGKPLLEASKNIFSLRDTFASRAAEGLNVYQRALPFLACVRAANLAAANNEAGSSYVAVALLAPFEGTEIDAFAGEGEGAEETVKKAEEEADEIRKSSEEAEKLAKEAEEVKRQAWLLDCGDEGKCLRERAQNLAGLSGKSNPIYASFETWSFSVPLARCRAYYEKRLALEERVQPRNPEEMADHILRERIYRYAIEEFRGAYAYETEEGFQCHFPLLPRNMAELRQTDLYTEPLYPFSVQGNGGIVMHACVECPGAHGGMARGSISLLESTQREMCPLCKFVPTSLASVCAATSVVSTGYEFYYRQIAQLAEKYKKLQDQVQDSAKPAKRKVRQLLDALGELLEQLGGQRIEICPPGAYGAVCIVVDCGSASVGSGMSAALLGGDISLGTRVAVSGATLLEDKSDGAASVITGIPALLGLTGEDGSGSTGALGVVAGAVFRLWNGLLQVYNSGQDALERVAGGTMEGFSWRSSSGLGAWAARMVKSALSKAGLGSASTSFVKPVLVNTALVAAADESAWAGVFLAVKEAAPAVASGGEAARVLSGVVGAGSSEGGFSSAEGGEGIPPVGIVISLSQELLGTESPLTLVFTLLSGEDAARIPDGKTMWGWAIGGLLATVGNERHVRDWR